MTTDTSQPTSTERGVNKSSLTAQLVAVAEGARHLGTEGRVVADMLALLVVCWDAECVEQTFGHLHQAYPAMLEALLRGPLGNPVQACGLGAKVVPAGFEVSPIHEKTRRRLKADEVMVAEKIIRVSPALARQLGDVKRVSLAFNRTTEEIRLLPAPPPKDASSTSYKLSARIVYSPTFTTHFQIKARGRFAAHVESGMLVIRLREPRKYAGRVQEDVRRRRAGR